MIKIIIIFLQTIIFSSVYIWDCTRRGMWPWSSQLYFHIYERKASLTTNLRRQCGRGEWIKIDLLQILAQYPSNNMTLGKFFAFLRLYLFNSKMLILIPICTTVVRIEITYVKCLHMMCHHISN